MSARPTVVVVDGCRTPFLRSSTDFGELRAYDLGRMAVAGLLHRTRIDPAAVDLVVMGTVLADPATTNLAREVSLGCGVPSSCPAYTVTVACVSSLQAALDGIRAIETGAASVVIAGGAETFSDVPIRYRRPVRKRLIASQKVRGLGGWLHLARGLKLRDLLPEVPALAEFSTRETMGQNAERLAKRVGVSREEQDAFALASHQRAAAATAQGLLARQIVPAWVPPAFRPVRTDNGIRADSSETALAKLRPAFDRRFGTVTAGNSSFLTDGAAAVLLASAERAEELGLEPLAVVRGAAVTGADPREELLLGPAFATPRALDQAGLRLQDVGVLEFHEAFAAQMVANVKLLADDRFGRDRLGRGGAVGRVDPERLNAWGGSLAVGHPFGATGARLITTCAHRMRYEGERFGAVAACAAGAIGIAMVFEAA
ncbi:MAG: acetyl-CoA C-acyltransferase [Acidobacteriota bacterium]